MWDLPGPGREPVSPALAGGFLTTAPPGKSHDWHLMLPVGWNTYTRPLHVDWASSQHDGIRLLTRQLRAPKANAPREPSRSYCLLWACLDVTYHCFKSQACSDSGGRNIDPTSQWGMSQTHCKSIWGGRYCCSNLWKVSSATVLETFPLGWRPWLNFLWIFSRPITQYLEKNTCSKHQCLKSKKIPLVVFFFLQDKTKVKVFPRLLYKAFDQFKKFFAFNEKYSRGSANYSFAPMAHRW